METIPYLHPQVAMVFVPNFKTKKVILRQVVFSDDWVADCYELDAKYKVWFLTLDQALEVLGRKSIDEL